jgi:ureidoglycolate lyase
LDRRPYLVVVAPAGADGSPGAPEAFLATGRQGVNYAAGTWHHPLISLEAECDFLVVDRDGPGENLEEHAFEDGWVIEALD